MAGVEGALVHIWGMGRCLDAWGFLKLELEVLKCTFGSCKC